MRRYHVEFSEKNLTGNAGLLHLGRFAEKLGLDKMLQQHIRVSSGVKTPPKAPRMSS